MTSEPIYSNSQLTGRVAVVTGASKQRSWTGYRTGIGTPGRSVMCRHLKKKMGRCVRLAVKRPEVGQYAATKHALKAIADSLREEVNPKGIPVLTLYLGRTATPMQEALFQQDGREYHPETLLQPEDVASVVVHDLMLPATAELTEISIRPMTKVCPDLRHAASSLSRSWSLADPHSEKRIRAIHSQAI